MESNAEAKPKIRKRAGSINRYAQIIKDLEQMLDYTNWLEMDSTKFSKDHGVTKSMLLLLCKAGCIERQKAKGKAALYEYRKTRDLEVLTPTELNWLVTDYNNSVKNKVAEDVYAIVDSDSKFKFKSLPKGTAQNEAIKIAEEYVRKENTDCYVVKLVAKVESNSTTTFF